MNINNKEDIMELEMEEFDIKERTDEETFEWIEIVEKGDDNA